MKRWLHKIEVIVDRIIPYLLVLLLFLIIGELFFYNYFSNYGLWVQIADGFIVGVFVLDLVFKYIRVKNIPRFFKKYWLDIIAVFPFFLLFRVLEEVNIFFRFGESVSDVQPFVHESLEIERETSKLIEESEKLGKLSRTRMVTRLIRPLERTPRLLKAFPYYERPTGRHHIHEKKK